MNVLEASRRQLVLRLESGAVLLRKGMTRPQRRRMAQIRARLQTNLSNQLGAERRRAFRGPVAVELELALPRSTRDHARLPALVKAHLDLLTGAVVPDDSSVDHLLVDLVGADDGVAAATFRCLPVSIFAAEFDRAFRLLDEIPAGEIERPRPLLNGAPNPSLQRESWALAPWDEGDEMNLRESLRTLERIDDHEAQEETLLEEDPDAEIEVELDLSQTDREMGLGDPEVRDRTRRDLEASIAFAYGRLLTNNGFDTRDRPGPPPTWLTEADLESPAEVVSLSEAGPGCVLLPAPRRRSNGAAQRPWDELATDAFRRHRLDVRWDLRFGGPLALDIALRGGAADHMDVDNVARRVIVAFNRAFNDLPPDIEGYRAYSISAPHRDIRVRLMSIARLRQLRAAMRQAEVLVKSEHGLRP